MNRKYWNISVVQKCLNNVVCVIKNNVKTLFANFLFINHAVIGCPVLNPPSNGMIDCTLGDDGAANPGDTCAFTCTGGFALDGSDVRTCLNDGNWSSTDAMCRGMVIVTQVIISKPQALGNGSA